MYIKGIVTIKLIDKKTNKIKYKTTSNNTMLRNGAYCFINGLTGKSTTAPISRIIIFDENKNYIKSIDLYYYELAEYQNTLYYYLEGYDHSEDEYTCKYVTLDREYSGTPTLENGYFLYTDPITVSKTKEYSFIAQWIIMLSYSQPP
jgi:hypothetical protein